MNCVTGLSQYDKSVIDLEGCFHPIPLYIGRCYEKQLSPHWNVVMNNLLRQFLPY